MDLFVALPSNNSLKYLGGIYVFMFMAEFMSVAYSLAANFNSLSRKDFPDLRKPSCLLALFTLDC